jgi:hypothetical protein
VPTKPPSKETPFVSDDKAVAAPAATAASDPALDKYRKMLKMGISKDAVAQKMIMDNEDPVRLGLGAPEDKDPALVKYKKMLQMGISKDAVAQKMSMDGLDPKRLNLKPPADAAGAKQSSAAKTAALKKAQNTKPDAPKRRKLHWETIKGDLIRRKGGSIWHTLNTSSNGGGGKEGSEEPTTPGGTPLPASSSRPSSPSSPSSHHGTKDAHGNELLHDFEALFVAAPSPPPGNSGGADEKEGDAAGGGGKKGKKGKEKKQAVVHVIDPQRAMNGGILLARMKEKSPAALGARLLSLDASGFTTEQLEALHSLIPTRKEATSLQRFKGDLCSLSVCEQTMLRLLAVPQASERLEALVFMRTLQATAEFLRSQAAVLQTACAALKASRKLRRVFHIILLLGNRLNHGGSASGGEQQQQQQQQQLSSPRARARFAEADEEGSEKSPAGEGEGAVSSNSNAVQAFTLRSLLNLASTKAFDGRTTVLEYLVRVLERDQVLDFAEGLEEPVAAAKRVATLSSADGELRRLGAGKDKVAALVATAVEQRRAWRLKKLNNTNTNSCGDSSSRGDSSSSSSSSDSAEVRRTQIDQGGGNQSAPPQLSPSLKVEGVEGAADSKINPTTPLLGTNKAKKQSSAASAAVAGLFLARARQNLGASSPPPPLPLTPDQPISDETAVVVASCQHGGSGGGGNSSVGGDSDIKESSSSSPNPQSSLLGADNETNGSPSSSALQALVDEKNKAAAARDFKRAAALVRDIQALETKSLPPSSPTSVEVVAVAAPAAASTPPRASARRPLSPNASLLADISKGPSRLRQRRSTSSSSDFPSSAQAEKPEGSGGREGAEEDPFAAVVGLSSFLDEAQCTIKTTSDELAAARVAFKDLLDYFCEVRINQVDPL